MMKMTEGFRIVRAPTYTLRVGVLANEALLQKRHIHRSDTDVDIDTFGDNWSFAYCARATASVHAWREGKLIPLVPPFGIYLPPFSIVEWQVSPGDVWFCALNSEAAQPRNAPTETEAFPLQLDRFPLEVADIERALSQRGAPYLIGRQNQINSIARRTKQEIDRTYRDNAASIGDIPKKLKCAHAVMSRSFKRCYGLSPIQYRNKMRIWVSMVELVKKTQPILSIAQDVGFGDLSQYNRMFRDNITVVPSMFRR